MKMSDEFTGDIYTIYHSQDTSKIADGNGAFGLVNDHCKNHVISAINNHDALVEACVGVFNDFSEAEISALPPSIVDVWFLGKKFSEGES